MVYTLQNEQIIVQMTTKGGTLCSVKDSEGTEYLWQGDPAYWTGQAPVLFPICGSIRDDIAETLDGKAIKMPRHGIVRKEEFKAESVTDKEVCFSIESTENMLGQYPYHFKLCAKYALDGKTIRTTYAVENKDRADMPFFIGGHPGFNCPISKGEAFSDYEIVFDKTENCTVPTPVTETGLIDMEQRTKVLDNQDSIPLEHSLFHKDAIIFDELQSRKVKLTHKEKVKGVELEFAQFPYLILWSTANDGPFVALEPWSGLSTCSDEDGILEHKRSVIIVKAGEMKELSYTITIL